MLAFKVVMGKRLLLCSFHGSKICPESRTSAGVGRLFVVDVPVKQKGLPLPRFR